MMTRRALSRQEESKLQLALQELKVARERCELLDRERDDNEKELLEILNKNTKLRKELTEMHNQLIVVTEERDQLRLIVDGFDKCSQEYEMALNTISCLQQELCEAQDHIKQLEMAKTSAREQQTQSLFTELMNIDPVLGSVSSNDSALTTIDLTENDTLHPSSGLGIGGCSKNKIKKYVKINRYIKKTQKLLKKHRQQNKIVFNLKEKLALKETVDLYTYELEQNKIKYDTDTQFLNEELEKLQSSLIYMTKKYANAQREIEEHSSALTELTELCKYNADRFDSLQSHNITCKCNGFSDSRPMNALSLKSNSSKTSLCNSLQNTEPANNSKKTYGNKQNIPYKVSDHVIMYSDEMGKKMGALVSLERGQTLLNNCMPNKPYLEIAKSIINCKKFKPNTKLIIFIGNRGNLNKNKLIEFYEQLCLLNLKEIVMFTLPYSEKLSAEENNIRYKLNLTMHMMCNNNNSFHIIDTNKYVSQLYSRTRDNFYLPLFIKRQIADVLSYYIRVSANNLANRLCSIEQIDINSDYSNLNNKTLNLN